MSAQRWVLRMHPLAAARSGCLSRILAVFADRGVSLDEVHADASSGEPVVRLGFAADPRSAQALRRRLERLGEVEAVLDHAD